MSATTDRSSFGTKFTIQLEESITVSSEALSLVYARYISDNNLQNELPNSVNLTSTTKGVNIFVADCLLKEQHLNYENIVGCCTDDAAAIIGKKLGLILVWKRLHRTAILVYIASFTGKHYQQKTFKRNSV